MASRQKQKEQARAARIAAEEADRRSARRRRSLIRLGALLGLAAVVVVVAIAVSSGGGKKTSGNVTANAKAALATYAGIPQRGVRLGAARGAPTLIEFADLQCPVCARYDIEVMRSVVDRYIRPGKVNYELRVHAILGPDSVRAAAAAASAADQDRLYPFTDLFYREQGSENSGYVTDGFLRRLASAIPGLNPDAVVRAANAPTRQPLFQEATRLAQALGSSSTPDFYLKLAGGRLVRVSPSALTPGAFAQALDAALAQKT